MALTHENLQATIINREIQRERAKKGETNNKRSIRVDSEVFHEGDRVLFTRNRRSLGVNNGDLGTVESISRIRNTMSVRIDGGRGKRTVNLDDYQHIKLGYAITVHKAQGATLKNVYALCAGAMQNLHSTYVQMSRAKERTRIYLDQAEAGEEISERSRLVQQMNREQENNTIRDMQRQQSGLDAIGLIMN